MGPVISVVLLFGRRNHHAFGLDVLASLNLERVGRVGGDLARVLDVLVVLRPDERVNLIAGGDDIHRRVAELTVRAAEACTWYPFP